MTNKTIVDSLFEPIFPSLKVLFLRYLKNRCLARNYDGLERISELTKQYKKTMAILQAQHKKDSEELHKICFKLRGLDHG